MAGIWALSNDGKLLLDIHLPINKKENSYAQLSGQEKLGNKNRLGNATKDNLGSSYVTALSSDGKIAVGYAETDSKSLHAIIWSGEN